MKDIFAFSTNDRRAWNIFPFLKKVQRRVMVELFILHIHYRHIHSSVLSITLPSTTSNGVDLTYFPMSELFQLIPNCIPQLPQTQSQIPNSPFQIDSPLLHRCLAHCAVKWLPRHDVKLARHPCSAYLHTPSILLHRAMYMPRRTNWEWGESGPNDLICGNDIQPPFHSIGFRSLIWSFLTMHNSTYKD